MGLVVYIIVAIKLDTKNVTNIAALKSIANQYQVLYMLSIKSRYNCLTIKNDELNKALDMLSIIENAIP